MKIDTEYLNTKRVTYTFDREEIIKALAESKGLDVSIDYDHSIELYNGNHEMGIEPYVKIVVDIPRESAYDRNDYIDGG